MKQRTGSGNGCKCARLDAVLGFVKHDLPHLNIDEAHCRCFCVECNKSRGDRPTAVHRRGQFPYVLPEGFAKVALRLLPVQAENLKTWAPAFHGTTVESAGAILSAKTGHYLLLNPGDVLPEGDALGVRDTHISCSFNRMNEHAKQQEHFDPTNKVFMSPSIRYASHPAYSPRNGEAVKLRITDPTHPGCSTEVSASIKVALDVRLDPGESGPGFGIGQETVGAGKRRIDPVLPNECLEYYTNRRQTHFVAALMVQIFSVEDKRLKHLVMNVPNFSSCLSPESALLPPVGFIEEPRDPEPEQSQESFWFKAFRGGGAVGGKNMATSTTTVVKTKFVKKTVEEVGGKITGKSMDATAKTWIDMGTTSLGEATVASSSVPKTLLTRGGTEMVPVKVTIKQTAITGASSALGGACVGAMSLPIGLVCDGARCVVGKGPKDMRKQFKTRLKNTPYQMIATSAGAAIGTTIFPGIGTQVGMVCGSIISALVVEEATE